MSPNAGVLPTHRAALAWIGAAVNDPRGVRVGRAAGVVVDRQSGALVWLLVETVRSGLRAVPIGDVTDEGGGRLTLAIMAAVVDEGPDVPRGGAFTGRLEQELGRVYRLPLARGEGRAWERRRTTGLLGLTPEDVLVWTPGPAGSGTSRAKVLTPSPSAGVERGRRGFVVVRKALGRLAEEASASIAVPPRADGSSSAEMPRLRRQASPNTHGPGAASTGASGAAARARAAHGNGNGAEPAAVAEVTSPPSAAPPVTSPPSVAPPVTPPPSAAPPVTPPPDGRLSDLLRAVEEIEAAAAAIAVVDVLLASSDPALWHPLVRQLGGHPRLRVRGCVGDGAAVLAQLADGPAVDVVLLDLERLDDLDAVATVKALRAAGHATLPVLLLTRTEGAWGELAPGVEVSCVTDPAAVAERVVALREARG